MQLDREKGYSAYVFSQRPSDYCIIDQEDMYADQRIYINVGAILLIFAIMFAAPLTLIGVHDDFYAKIKNTNAMFFVWSLVLVSALAAIVMIVFDGFTIAYNLSLYPSNPHDEGFYDIFAYFVAFAVILGVIVICDLIFMTFALRHIHLNGSDLFPVPVLFKLIQRSCDSCETDVEGQRCTPFKKHCCEYLVLLFGCSSFTLFLQLSSFHFLYILLGILSTPVETVSITTFYIACFFCLVAFVAIALKSSNNSRYFELKLSTTIKFAFFLLAAGLFTGSAILFSMFFYNYIIMVQSYRDGDGILAIIGSIFPSVLVTLSGFGGTKLINCIKDPSTAEERPVE